MNNYNQLIKVLINTQAVRATIFNDPKFIIRAVRKSYGGKFVKGNIEIHLTIGRPNYAERKFIKLCQKAGEKFPIKKIQLKFLKSHKKIK